MSASPAGSRAGRAVTASARALLLAGAATLGACYEFQAPIDATPTRNVDPALMGSWRCLPMSAGPEERAATVVIGLARERVYSIRFEAPGDEPGRYEAYASQVKGRT